MVPLVTFQIFTWLTGSLYVKPAGWLTRLSASYAATLGAWPLATGSRVGSATAPLPPLAPVAVLSQPSDARTPASATASTAGTRGRSETGTSMAKVWSESRSSSVMPVTRHPRLAPYRSVAPLRIQFPSSARSWSVIAVTFPSGMVWVTTATARIRSARARISSGVSSAIPSGAAASPATAGAAEWHGAPGRPRPGAGRVRQASLCQGRDHLRGGRDDHHEAVRRHDRPDRSADVEIGGAGSEQLREAPGGCHAEDEQHARERERCLAETRPAQRVVDEPTADECSHAHGDRGSRAERRDLGVDEVGGRVEIVDQDEQDEATQPRRVRLPLEPVKRGRKRRGSDRVLDHAVEPTAVDRPELSGDARLGPPGWAGA